MKKMLTLRNILLCCGALLAVVAFFVAFAAGVKGDVGGAAGEMQGLIIGKEVVIVEGEKQISDAEFHAGLSLVGIIMMLVGGLAAVVVALLVKKPWAKWVVIGCAVVILVGAVFVFLVKSSYINSYRSYLIKQGTPSQYVDQAVEMMKESFKELKLNAGTVITAILGILGAGAIGASQFVPEK